MKTRKKRSKLGKSAIREPREQNVAWTRQVVLIFRDGDRMTMKEYLLRMKLKLGVEKYRKERALHFLDKAIKAKDVFRMKDETYQLNPSLQRRTRSMIILYPTLLEYMQGEGILATKLAKLAGVHIRTFQSWVRTGGGRDPSLRGAYNIWLACKKRFPLSSFLVDKPGAEDYVDEDGGNNLDIL